LTEIQIWELAAIFVMVAMFYSSVGHAGASGYLAAMAIVGVAPELMRPTALTLNIVIAAFTTWRFRSARFFDVRIVGAFLVGSVPMAFIGGGIKLPTEIYKMLVGVILLCSATYLVWRGYAKKFRSVPIAETPLTVPMFIAPFIGAAVGLLSGLTGTGGGIFLSPIVLLMAWAGPKATAGIAAPFIMVNSVAGLSGGLYKGTFALATIPDAAVPLCAAALAGAMLGTWLGLYKLSNRLLILTLAFVMLIAAVKLLGLT
jgi:uncharacterized membrane protein YfcA